MNTKKDLFDSVQVHVPHSLGNPFQGHDILILPRSHYKLRLYVEAINYPKEPYLVTVAANMEAHKVLEQFLSGHLLSIAELEVRENGRFMKTVKLRCRMEELERISGSRHSGMPIELRVSEPRVSGG